MYELHILYYFFYFFYLSGDSCDNEEFMNRYVQDIFLNKVNKNRKMI